MKTPLRMRGGYIEGMCMNITMRMKRKAEVKGRVSTPNYDGAYCRVVGCQNPARAATGEGLDNRFCRPHAEHYARHGSPYRKSYTAPEVRPYRKAAADWIKANASDPWVVNAMQRVRGLYATAGGHVEAFRLRGLSPEERAKAAWARLRKAGVDPVKVLADVLAVEMIIRDDPQADHKREFKEVQAAKLVHRMASGTHKRWGEGASATELHVFPRSRGRVLRHLGKDALEVGELVVDHHQDALPKARVPKEAQR
jgi:hypothetical protein